MITTVFGFGNYDKSKEMDPIIGRNEDQQYGIAVALLITAALFIPIMLCVKPCIALASQPDEPQVEENADNQSMNSDGLGKPENMGIQMNEMGGGGDGADLEGGNASEESVLMEGGEMMMMGEVDGMESGDKKGEKLAEKRVGEMKSLD